MRAVDDARFENLMERLRRIGPRRWDDVFEAISAGGVLESAIGRELVGLALVGIAAQDPERAVALAMPLVETMTGGDLLGARLMGEWCLSEPSEALDWIRAHEGIYPDRLGTPVKEAIIRAVAVSDPSLALHLHQEFGLSLHIDVVGQVTSVAITPGEKDAALAAWREFLPRIQGRPEYRSVEGLFLARLAFGSRSDARSDFESASSWIDSAGLSPQEIRTLVAYMEFGVRLRDTGKWIEWIGDRGLVDEGTVHRVRRMGRNWVESDYPSAQEWLTSAPDGPLKTAVAATLIEGR